MDCHEKKKADANSGLVWPRKKLDLAEVRAKLADARGPQYWRSLEELAGSEGFEELLHDEFPRHASEWHDGVSRRDFMKIAGASLALAGLVGCTKQPIEMIVPYVQQPEEVLPGRPLYFATAMPAPWGAVPLLVKSNEGRPTKAEGNPGHPASEGATDTFAQASILGMYDPDRSQTVMETGEVRAWSNFVAAIRPPLIAQKAIEGATMRILTGAVISPTLYSQIQQLLQSYPQAKWHQYEPVNPDNALAGAQLAFGQPVQALYKFDAADVVLSLDDDFLSPGHPGCVRYARDYARRRKLRSDRTLNRLYAVESAPSLTGGKAEHRIGISAAEVELFTRALAAKLGVAGASGGSVRAEDQRFFDTLVKDLQSHRGTSLVIAGDHQSPAVHALAHAMNDALGNVGKTVTYADRYEFNPTANTQSLRELVADMNAKKVDVLLMVGGNPVYNAPVDLNFAEAMQNVNLRVHLSLYMDETSALSHWHVNAAHYLESWSDARSHAGVISIVQPLIAPLYDGKTAHEFLAAFTDQPTATSYDILRNYWKQQHAGADFEHWWRKSLHDGFLPDTMFPEKNVALKLAALPAPPKAPTPDSIEINFRPDPTVWDGRFSNNGWLQELPKPLTRLTWDNVIILSPATAERLKIGLRYFNAITVNTNEEYPHPPSALDGGTNVVEIEYRGRKLKGPVWVQPGHPDNAITVHLGYGRLRAGRVGTGFGFSAYNLRTSDAPDYAQAAKLNQLDELYDLASTQHHQTMMNRDLVRVASLDEFKKNPNFAHANTEEPPAELTLYPGYHYEGYAWAMAIDLNSCIGCQACVVACVSENNIAVVGKSGVLHGRQMYWLRIDNYYQGSMDNPKVHFQPVPCMQCENAPCEEVCPVGATVHSSEGLNDMVYNRCVGTRYCSNNCPYKVRRFNFFLFQDWNTPQFKMMRNPDVTVRSRGVMEKCTYCVQRINRGRIHAEEEDRKVQDQEIQTACQQACPTEAIVFGDKNDKNSLVAKLRANPRNYGLLDDLNTRPRTTYIAGVHNPNPDLEKA
jgi:MoCo/4Fe-4S cofactor protein with predicted Tat translocation signal